MGSDGQLFPQVAQTQEVFDNNLTTNSPLFLSPKFFRFSGARLDGGSDRGQAGSRRRFYLKNSIETLFLPLGAPPPDHDFALKIRSKTFFNPWSLPSRPRYCLEKTIGIPFFLFALTPHHNFALTIRWKTCFSSWRISP